MPNRVVTTSRVLVCVECGRHSNTAHRWRAVLVGADDDGLREPYALVVYCPPCWENEVVGAPPQPG